MNAIINDKLVERAASRAAAFAAAARRVEGNGVSESVEEGRLFSWLPLRRTYRVEVIDRTGRVTVASWDVPLEKQAGGRRSIRFFGWGFAPAGPGKRYSESMCFIRVTN